MDMDQKANTKNLTDYLFHSLREPVWLTSLTKGKIMGKRVFVNYYFKVQFGLVAKATKYFEEIATQTEYISEEKVEIKVLDTLFDSICKPEEIVFLKLDTQGYEKNILNGATESLKKIKGVQIELALKPSYNDAPGFKEIFKILEDAGFTLYSVEEGFEDENTGQLLEIDAIFFRE